jgi:hypothetical protein
LRGELIKFIFGGIKYNVCCLYYLCFFTYTLKCFLFLFQVIKLIFVFISKNVAFVHEHTQFQNVIITKINEFLSLQQTSIILENLLSKHFNVTMHESIIEWLGLFHS